MEEKLDKLFHLKERGTTVRTEVLAGLTTFVTAAYALAVNPSVMSATGMDSGAVFTAAAPALVIVGSFMASSVLSIDFDDPTESIPAFLCFVGMPFCYSIVEGISMGINLLCGNHKKISPMMYVLAVVFILKYVRI